MASSAPQMVECMAFCSVHDMIHAAILYHNEAATLREVYSECSRNGRIAYKKTGISKLITQNNHWKSQIRHALYTSDRFQREGGNPASNIWTLTKEWAPIPPKTTKVLVDHSKATEDEKQNKQAIDSFKNRCSSGSSRDDLWELQERARKLPPADADILRSSLENGRLVNILQKLGIAPQNSNSKLVSVLSRVADERPQSYRHKLEQQFHDRNLLRKPFLYNQFYGTSVTGGNDCEHLNFYNRYSSWSSEDLPSVAEPGRQQQSYLHNKHAFDDIQAFTCDSAQGESVPIGAMSTTGGGTAHPTKAPQSVTQEFTSGTNAECTNVTRVTHGDHRQPASPQPSYPHVHNPLSQHKSSPRQFRPQVTQAGSPDSLTLELQRLYDQAIDDESAIARAVSVRSGAAREDGKVGMAWSALAQDGAGDPLARACVNSEMDQLAACCDVKHIGDRKQIVSSAPDLSEILISQRGSRQASDVSTQSASMRNLRLALDAIAPPRSSDMNDELESSLYPSDFGKQQIDVDRALLSALPSCRPMHVPHNSYMTSCVPARRSTIERARFVAQLARQGRVNSGGMPTEATTSGLVPTSDLAAAVLSLDGGSQFFAAKLMEASEREQKVTGDTSRLPLDLGTPGLTTAAIPSPVLPAQQADQGQPQVKRKRGRPRKVQPPPATQPTNPDSANETPQEKGALEGENVKRARVEQSEQWTPEKQGAIDNIKAGQLGTGCAGQWHGECGETSMGMVTTASECNTPLVTVGMCGADSDMIKFGMTSGGGELTMGFGDLAELDGQDSLWEHMH